MDVSNVYGQCGSWVQVHRDLSALLPDPSPPLATSLAEKYGLKFIPTYSPSRSRQNPSLTNSEVSSEDDLQVDRSLTSDEPPSSNSSHLKPPIG